MPLFQQFTHFQLKAAMQCIQGCIPLVRQKFHSNSFFPGMTNLWNRLLRWCFPEHYNLYLFKCQINPYQILTSSFHNPTWKALGPCIMWTTVKDQNFLLTTKNMFSKAEWSDIIFQQDNTSKYSTRSTKKGLGNKWIRLMFWPSESPMLNSWDNIWSCIKYIFQTFWYQQWFS